MDRPKLLPTAIGGDRVDERLADFFRPGVEPADVAALHPLQQARPSIQGLIALFTGTEAAVLMRLLLLRELGGRGSEPYWTAAELRARFSYVEEGKLENLIGRLRIHGLLAWDGETARYSLSPLGRMMIAALSALLRFGNDDDEIGYIAGQLAASGAVGTVSQDELQHLLARLTELKDEFERAILSGSEPRIRGAEQRLESVWRWVDKGSDILKSITENGELDAAAHRVAQRIGQVQSELLRMSGAFQRALNLLESQRVHLGATGLSSSDISNWLRSCGPDALAALAEGNVEPVPDFAFMLGDIALDIAEFELIDKLLPQRLHVPLPDAANAPPAGEVDLESPDWAELEHWRDELRVAVDGTGLAEAVPLRDYELSSYRLSLLSLLGDPQSAALEGPVAELSRIDVRADWRAGISVVGRNGVAEMSEGRLRRLHRPTDLKHQDPDGIG